MKVLSYILSFLIAVNSYAGCKKPIVIAVVDTGMGKTEASFKAHLCKYGHKDFTNDGDFINVFHTKDKVPFDFAGHGTNIAGIIDSAMKKSGKSYCIVVLKAFSSMSNQQGNPSINAFIYASAIKVDIINYSAGGYDYNELEKTTILKFIENGGIFVTAAGNDGRKMEPPYVYYPAMYDKKIISVSNTYPDGSYGFLSNYGAESRKEVGQLVKGFGITLSGTSQATAVATGKIGSALNKRCDR